MKCIKTYHSYSTRIRNFLSSKYYASIFGSYGHNTRVLGRLKVYSPNNIQIGSYSTLNEGCLLNARAELKIGSHVHISPYVSINTGGLDFFKFRKERVHVSEPVTIEDGVWIGTGAIINPGITIGADSVIGAGAVVAKNVDPNVVVAGVPAKVIKELK